MNRFFILYFGLLLIQNPDRYLVHGNNRRTMFYICNSSCLSRDSYGDAEVFLLL